jgi:hypothetical protein
MKLAASKIVNIVRSLFEVVRDHEKTQGAGETIAYALIQVCGWQPVARALGRYADNHPKADLLHSYLRPPHSTPQSESLTDHLN